MKYNYYIVDVFTNEIFNGAQIAVFPNADGLNVQKMALIAKEFNLSETVFIFHKMNEDQIRRMRVFTPLGEINFAGHPIIAAAYVLGFCGDVELTEALVPLTFIQNDGAVEVNISSAGGQPTFIQFTRKVSSIIDHFVPIDEELAGFLGIEQSELDHQKYSPKLVSCGYPYLIVPVWKYESVRKAKFNYSVWSESMAPQTAAQEILLFAPKTPFQDSDFNLRLLGPNIGIHDDPPVGSSLPAFCSYLCSFEQLQKGTHTFAVDRGDANSRRSVLHLEMDHKAEELLTIRVGGHAVMFAQGSIKL